LFRPNRLKSRLNAGFGSTGCWLFMGSPTVAEVLAPAGFDALIIDHEHSPGGLETAVDQLRATSRSDVTVLARLAENSAAEIKRLLDAGVEGVIAPNVESAEEVRRLVDAAYYPPRGRRGAHFTVSRAASWGAASEAYFKAIEDEILVVAMIESVKGVAAIPEMVAVPGLDMLFIGPLDLSASIGEIGRYEAPAFQALLATVEQTVLASGVRLGGTELPGLPAAALFSRGYSFVTAGSDVGFLRQAACAAARAAAPVERPGASAAQLAALGS